MGLREARIGTAALGFVGSRSGERKSIAGKKKHWGGGVRMGIG
jgi:hypothetical protein